MTSILLHEYVEQVETLVDANRLVEAIEHCRHILHHYPRHIDTYRVMGKALLEKQDHNAATDLFLRILGADPNDFISHVGLSIIYKEEQQYDQALWHLERAFEIQPYNVAIQGELRQLYAVETETRPGVIPLTKGALARLYMKGELYQQAISELKRILADEPERMDLQVLLAEALWWDGQRIDAEEVCLNVLDELPNCIILNAILAEIWLQTGRIPEAQKYLKRLQGLTWQTKKTVQKESISGRAFTIEGAFALPEKAPLEFLETGTVIPSEPAKPSDDWVREVTFDGTGDDGDQTGEVVLEPESGMHSYDWLADIESEETAASDKKSSETDWFSQETAKEALNLSTNELNADWLADLRGEDNEEDESGFQPLELDSDLGDDVASDETDWFTNEDDISDELFAELADSASGQAGEEVTAVDSDHDWLNELADPDAEDNAEPREKSNLQIDATNLMDENLMNWDQIDSDPGVVKEPKTPFWLSEMADEAIDAVELNPDEALDWLAEPEENLEATVEAADKQPEAKDSLDWLAEIPEESVDETDSAEIAGKLSESDADVEEDPLDWLGEISEHDAGSEPVIEEGEDSFGPTAVLDPEEQINLSEMPNQLDTDGLGDADDWLAALTEGTIEEEIGEDEDSRQPSEDISLNTTTDELAALSNGDDWQESASADLDYELDAAKNEGEEFPNLLIPDMEDAEIGKVPDWLHTDSLDHSEEAETAMSSENDPQEKPQSEEPEVEPSKTAAQDENKDTLDWLADLTDDATDESGVPIEPPIATEGMPSWLEDAGQEEGVDVVDEWDSQSADIPDWLQEPVELSELDDAVLDEGKESEEVGLTGLLSEIDVSEEAVPLDDMDSLFSDWADEEDDSSLTGLLDDMGMDAAAPETKIDGEEIFASDDISLASEGDDEFEEVGLTGLLSNLTLDDDATEADLESDDFLSDILAEAEGDDLSDFLADDSEEKDAIFDPDGVEDDFSLTALLSDADGTAEEADEPTAVSDDEIDNWLTDLSEVDDGDDWLSDLADAEPELSLEGKPDEEGEGLTGMLANLWPDDIDADSDLPETADSDLIDAEPTKLSTDNLGLTDLLAGIETSEEVIDSRPELPDLGEPVEPSLTEILSGMDMEGAAEQPDTDPISAEDTTWLTQLEADTGSLQEQEDEFDMAEETGLDWLTLPDEPEDTPEEPVAEEPTEVKESLIVEEQDSTPEDWDDAMSWLEELAAQQEDPVGELPSVAETMLDEELDSSELSAPSAEVVDEADSFGSTDWLDDLTGDVTATFEDEPSEPEILPETKVMEESPEAAETAVPDEEDADADPLAAWDEDGEISWLDELATGRLAEEAAVDDAETVPEQPELELPTDDDSSWLDDLVEETDEFTSDDASLDELLGDFGEDAETAVDEADIGWLDTVLDEPLSEPDIPTDFVEEVEEAVIELGETPEVEESVEAEDGYRVTGITDALKADDNMEEAEADLEEALAWLDELEEEPSAAMLEIPEEAPPTIVTPPEAHEIADIVLDEESPETVVLPPEPDELALALDRLEQQVKDEGIVVPETAVFPIMLSDDELNAALDWIEQGDSEPEVPVSEVIAPTQEEEISDTDDDLAQMADDPEAWLEDLLSGDLEIDMEPPPIKPSEDAMFITDDAAVVEPETVEDAELDTADSLLEDVALDGLPDDPDAAVAWLDQLVNGDDALDIELEPPPIKPSEDAMFVTDDSPEEADVVGFEGELETAVAAEVGPEDDPEAWLEGLLSGDIEVDMEPPPIKPSEDAVFMTDDAPQPETVEDPETEALVGEIDPILEESSDEEVEKATLDLGDMEDDPEAWLEGLLSGDLDVDMEPPPIKPSEDAVYATDDAQQQEPAAIEEPEMVEEQQEADDIIADVPDDPDEAMAWLEQLAARQGADLEELPSVTDSSDLFEDPEMPDWMAEDVAELSGEPEESAEVGVAEDETSADAGELVDEDVDAELPDWLGSSDDRPVAGETDWLENLPDVDMDSWLTAEAEAAAVEPVEEVKLPDTGPLSRPSDTGPLVEDDLFDPIIEPSSGAYSVDEAKLSVAQDALADGRIDEAISQYKSLVAEGSGMMVIIAELEQASDAHPQAPALNQVLGDAYMRNGQLQKALAAYRSALNQM